MIVALSAPKVIIIFWFSPILEPVALLVQPLPIASNAINSILIDVRSVRIIIMSTALESVNLAIQAVKFVEVRLYVLNAMLVSLL